MKIWEKYRKEDLERYKQEFKEKLEELEQGWRVFGETGSCLHICCEDCPLLDKHCIDMSEEVKVEEINKEVTE